MSDHEPGLVVIWDSSEKPPDGVMCVLWDGYDEANLQTSLLQRLEQDGHRYREMCLEWAESLSEMRIHGERLADRILLEPGLSYWPMTLVAELNYLKSRSFLDILRLLVLEELLGEVRPQRVRLVTKNRALGQSVTRLCDDFGMQFEWSGAKPGFPRLRRRIDKALLTIGAIFRTGRWLFHIWPLRQARGVLWRDDPRSVFICTYNLAAPTDEDMEVRSYARYWGELPALLVDSDRPLNWLHSYLPTPGRRPREAVDGVMELNVDMESHVFVQSWLSIPLVFDALQRWRRLRRAAHAVGTRPIEKANGDRSWLWPVVDGDWMESFFGPTALSNLLGVELFDRALAGMPRQETGLYLFENQSWEPAFVHAWRKHGHGRLLGVAHTVARFWDLRYFRNKGEETAGCPSADLIVTNGPAMVSAMTDAGVDPLRIVGAEALRFSHLHHCAVRSLQKHPTESGLRLLVLGDYEPSSTKLLLGLLGSATTGLSRSIVATLRAHPNHPVDLRDYPDLNLGMTSLSMCEVIQDSDLVLGGNVTSAVAESFALGCRTVVALDQSGLNFSPLRSMPGVDFVANDVELRNILETCDMGDATPQSAISLFHLDEQLPRWRQLLCI